jgi:hypothetical protein
MRNSLRPPLTLAALLAVSAFCAFAQQPGPIAPLPGKEVRRIPAAPGTPTPPMPAPEIIRQFVAREDEYFRAHASYGFHRTIRLQEFPADGSEGGELNLEQDIFLSPNGKRYEKSLKETSKELKSAQLDIQDLKELARLPFFPFSSQEASRYNFTYVGLQPLDELNTYVFRVQPKQLERAIRQLEGLIYVDDRDLAIVKIYGRWIADVDEPQGGRPFVMFDVQRENVDGKYWFPDYIRSDGFVQVKEGQTRLRLTIKMTDFKAGAVSPPAPQPSPSQVTPPGSAAPGAASSPNPPKPPAH